MSNNDIGGLDVGTEEDVAKQRILAQKKEKKVSGL